MSSPRGNLELFGTDVASRAREVRAEVEALCAAWEAGRADDAIHRERCGVRVEALRGLWRREPALFGKEQEIEIGHYSGESNVTYWLKKRGLEAEPGLVKRILTVAKSGDHILTEDEVRQIIKDYRAQSARGELSLNV